MFDSTNCVSSGLLRGLGLQKIGALIQFIGYYIFGIPIAALVKFLQRFVSSFKNALLSSFFHCISSPLVCTFFGVRKFCFDG